jgi:hypothetical protein
MAKHTAWMSLIFSQAFPLKDAIVFISNNGVLLPQ